MGLFDRIFGGGGGSDEPETPLERLQQAQRDLEQAIENICEKQITINREIDSELDQAGSTSDFRDLLNTYEEEITGEIEQELIVIEEKREEIDKAVGEVAHENSRETAVLRAEQREEKIDELVDDIEEEHAEMKARLGDLESKIEKQSAGGHFSKLRDRFRGKLNEDSEALGEVFDAAERLEGVDPDTVGPA